MPSPALQNPLAVALCAAKPRYAHNAQLASVQLNLATTPEGAVPEWIELIPAPDASGAVVGDDGRHWTLDAAAVAASFRRPIPIDVNHATHTAATQGGDSPARGWVEALEARNGAVWGRVEWTAAGAAAVRGKEYRFISPALVVNEAGAIVGLRSVGLVNDPNFNLALNRAASIPVSAAPDEETLMLEKILAALGVAADADEAVALNVIAKLKNDFQTALNARATPDLNAYVPRADFDALKTRAESAETTLATNARQALDAEIDREVDAALKAGKITPATKDFYVATCRAEGGLDKFRAFVKTAPKVVADATPHTAPVGADAASLTPDQLALCRRMGLSTEDFIKSAQALAR